MNEKATVLKAVFSAGAAVFVTYFRMIEWPLIILGILAVTDYVTGMISAYIRNRISSSAGFKGILKKISYAAVIAVGISCDALISGNVGSSGNMLVTTAVVVFWLSINEMISILENLTEIGVPVPGFLKNVVNKLRIKSEDENERK